ncbi:MAG: bifunctional oligoribonuclease/PAP phosphatase NrnA [Clostridia bacterium]|nr:bifunctional oligoribonuclease/PAP phosphatase NrnA [Clostridia bacterium]
MIIAKDKLYKFKTSVNSATTIALFCHINPDGDTIGTALALFFALKKIDKEVRIFCDDTVPEKLHNLDGSDKFEKCDASGKEFDLAIAIDCSDISRLGTSARCFLKVASTIAVDHHKTHSNFAKLTIVDSEASATAEIIYQILDYCELMDDIIAKLIFGAMVSDNGCFGYSSTTAQSHEIAKALYSFKFNPSDVIYDIWKKKSVGVFNLSTRVLSKCRFFYDNKVAIITFCKEDFDATGTSQTDTEGIISNIIDIDTVEVAFAISEANEFYYKVSIRTKKKVDASDCAAAFGGGGHSCAAGCRINGRYEDVIERLVKTATDRLD